MSSLLQCPESFLDWGPFNKRIAYFLCDLLLALHDAYASRLPVPAHTQLQNLRTSIVVGYRQSMKSQTGYLTLFLGVSFCLVPFF